MVADGDAAGRGRSPGGATTTSGGRGLTTRHGCDCCGVRLMRSVVAGLVPGRRCLEASGERVGRRLVGGRRIVAEQLRYRH
jgi:hypothetical protein